MHSRVLGFASRYRNEIIVGCLVYATLIAKDFLSLLQQLT